MKIFDMSAEMAQEISEKLDFFYNLTNYLLIRKKDNKEEIFCFGGEDVIEADNIAVYMNTKKDGYKYFLSEELTSFK